MRIIIIITIIITQTEHTHITHIQELDSNSLNVCTNKRVMGKPMTAFGRQGEG